MRITTPTSAAVSNLSQDKPYISQDDVKAGYLSEDEYLNSIALLNEAPKDESDAKSELLNAKQQDWQLSDCERLKRALNSVNIKELLRRS